MNILQVKKYYLLIKGNSRASQIFIFSFRKAYEKQKEKLVDALKSLNLSDKTDELKWFESIFPKKVLNDLIIDKSKEIIKL